MTFAELQQLSHIDKVMIHSLESSMYQVSILLGEEEHYLTTPAGEPLHSRNKTDLQKLFADMQVNQMVLCHTSAYDEMIGLPSTNNRLEVPLAMTCDKLTK